MIAGEPPGALLGLIATVIWSLVGLAIASLVARRARTAAGGVFAGVVVGGGVMFVPPFLMEFLGYAVPWGQLEFMLTTVWYRLLGA